MPPSALHMLARRARPAPRACLELTFFSGMVHGAPNFDGSLHSVRAPATLIEDCSAVRASFLAGVGRAGWLWLACHFVSSIWRAVSPHGTPKPRQKRCKWRQMASFLHFVSHTISVPLSTSLSSSLEHDAHAAACTPPSSLIPSCALLSAGAMPCDRCGSDEHNADACPLPQAFATG